VPPRSILSLRPHLASAPARRARSRFIACLSAACLALAACAGSIEDRLAEVRALQDAGQFNESIEPLRELLQKNPDQPEANYLLGVALVQTGQLSLAVWPLEKAAADPAQAVSAGLLLASTFLGLESPEDAVRVSTKVIELDPERIAALKVRSQALLAANRRDEALADTEKLRKLQPDDYQALLMQATILAEVGRTAESEKAHEELEALAAKSGDASTVARACLARATFFKDNVKDEARAEAQFRQCLQKAPTDALALRLVTQFFDDRKRGDEATAIWANALEEAPENLQVRAALASRYEAQGKGDRALALHKEGVELLGNTQAWYALAEFERRSKRPEKSLEALDQAIAASPNPNENLIFFKSDLLIDLDRLDESEQLSSGLKEPSFRDLIKGRILLARGDAQGALATFDSGLKRWPNNAGGRYLAGLAAHRVGDFARAESEFREALRVDPSATDAGYSLATLYLAQGRYKESAEMARIFVASRGGARPEGYVTYVKAAIAVENWDGAEKTIEALEEAGFPKEGANARVSLALAQHGADAALREASKRSVDWSDRDNELALRAIIERMTRDGKTAEAEKLVAGFVAKQPDAAWLHEIQGSLLLRLDRTAEAQAQFEQAAQLDAKLGRAKAGLATLAANAGDLPRAVALFDEAAKLDENETSAAYAAAQLVSAQGDAAGARQRLEAIIAKDPSHAGARNDLAWALAQSGENLERAQSLAEAAYRLDPSPEIADTLGYVMMQRGQAARAAELFEQALAKRPESASIRYHLGLALAKQGEKERALDTLRRALASGPFPEAEAAKSEIARLEAK
jgi:tetratricopeptide (TPR) repeat protein